MVNRYSFNIEWSEEDEEYIATCPAFPGLSAFGETEWGSPDATFNSPFSIRTKDWHRSICVRLV